MRKVWLRPCLALAISALAASVHAGGIEYTLTDLGNNIDPYAINAEGHVTGEDFNTNQAFLYNGKSVSDIGVQYSQGNAINSSDEIAGYAGLAPFVYGSGSGVSVLGQYGQANGINSSGEVVGGPSPGGLSAQVFLYSGGSVTDLTAPGAFIGDALGINDSGLITGSASFSGSSDFSDAYIYNSTNGTIEDLDGLPGTLYSSGVAINSSGEVGGAVYYVDPSGAPPGTRIGQAFLWNGTTMVGLGTLSGGYYSIASAINDSGTVVGISDIGIGSHAFIYSNGVMTDLNSQIDPSLGLILARANGINDNGQIIATAYGLDGEEGVLLTPVVPLPTALPAGLGLLGLVAIARRRRSVA